MVKEIFQYDVYWISLDPTLGSEMAKNRPCVVVSPNEMNKFLRTLIIIPITSTIKNYPWWLNCRVAEREGSIATDQLKVIDKIRVGSKIGKLSDAEIMLLKVILQKMLVN